jgi:hypothetical protein
LSISVSDRPRARGVSFSKGEMIVLLDDGRSIGVPLEWFPRLRDASEKDLLNFSMIGGGIGIHWPKLDEDLSVRGLLLPDAAPVKPARKVKGKAHVRRSL